MNEKARPSRAARRSWLQVLLTFASIGLIVAASVVLYRMLHDLALAQIVAAVSALPSQRVALAAMLVVGSYATLTLYDFFALRTLGLTVIGYRTAALAGFASYAIGHSIGATTFVAGVVRYRVYAPHGLDALAVAKVCIVASLTFWLGNAALLGAGMAWHPQAVSAINQLPQDVNRGAAFVLLAVLALYTTWVWRGDRRVGSNEIGIVLPDGPSTLLQIGIGVVDLAFCAMALYVLAPVGYGGGLTRFMVVFVCALLLGFASHAPAGIGVFDAVMLLGMPELDRAELVATLIVFRVLYYLLPLAVAVGLLARRELMLVLRELRAKWRFRPVTVGADYTSATARNPREGRAPVGVRGRAPSR
jgi:uncharacterized membrane protein YbhN (UPF0104 family)